MIGQHRFRPRLLDAWRRSTPQRIVQELGAGCTVGIVALPLATVAAPLAVHVPLAALAGTRCVVLQMHRRVSMGTSGLDAPAQLYSALRRRDIALGLASVNPQPLGLIRRSGFETVLGADQIVPSVDDLAEADFNALPSPSVPASAG